MRQEHDAAHWITVRLLGIIEPCLRGEELLEFYREAMPIVEKGIRDYAVRSQRERSRLRVGESDGTPPEESSP